MTTPSIFVKWRPELLGTLSQSLQRILREVHEEPYQSWYDVCLDWTTWGPPSQRHSTTISQKSVGLGMFFLVDTCSPSFHFRCHHVMSSMFWNLKKNITSYIFFTCEVSIEEAQEKSAGGVTLTLPGRITSVYLEYFGCSTGWIKTQDLLPFTSFHCNPLGYLPRRTGHYIFDHEASAEEKKRILGDTVQEKAFFFDVHSFP